MNRRGISQINKNLAQLIKVNNIPFYKKGEFYVSALLAIAAIIIGLAALRQDRELSNQAQQIDGFKQLLRNSESQKDTLNKALNVLSNQLKVLSNQLKLNEEEQIQSNQDNEYKRANYEASFRSSAQNLKLYSFMSMVNPLTEHIRDWEPERRDSYVLNISEILKQELANPFLLQNPKLAKEWNDVYIKSRTYFITVKQNILFNEKGNMNEVSDRIFINFMGRIILLQESVSHHLEKYASKKYLYNDWRDIAPDTIRLRSQHGW